MAFKSIMMKSLASVLSLGMAASVSAATFTLDFGTSFGDPTDPDTESPDGPAPWLTALFDDGGSSGSVTLTLTVAGTVGAAEVTAVYLNVDDTIGDLAYGTNTGTGPDASISISQDTHKAGNDGLFDILFDLPPPGSDRFTAGETLVYEFTGTGLVASSFNFWSTPDPSELDPSGPFLGAAKFATTGSASTYCADGIGECSDWVGAVPVPAAVWLFGSGLLGLIGIARRRK